MTWGSIDIICRASYVCFIGKDKFVLLTQLPLLFAPLENFNLLEDGDT